jgi:hypothetical protein
MKWRKYHQPSIKQITFQTNRTLYHEKLLETAVLARKSFLKKNASTLF